MAGEDIYAQDGFGGNGEGEEGGEEEKWDEIHDGQWVLERRIVEGQEKKRELRRERHVRYF